MSDKKSGNLHSGEAKIGRFLLRLSLAVAWGAAAWIVYMRADSLEISYTMKFILAGFATVMAIVSFVQAMGNYGPEEKEPRGKNADIKNKTKAKD